MIQNLQRIDRKGKVGRESLEVIGTGGEKQEDIFAGRFKRLTCVCVLGGRGGGGGERKTKK